MKEHAHKHYHASMLGVEEALSRILEPFHTLEIEDKSLLNSLGQVLAEDILSNINVPPWPNSAMDGYALQFNSIEKATSESPIFLKVIGNAAAGYMPKERVVPGTAIRIMTGAPIPQGADTVIPFEDTDEEQRKTDGDSLKEIGIKITAPKGACIRAAAEDISIGETVLKKGQTLRSGEIGVIASLGLKTVKVIRRPLIGILATGDELIEPGNPMMPGKIYNSNTYSIASATLKYGGIPKILGIAKDNLDSMNHGLKEGLKTDLLLTTAGVSKGDYDMVKDVLANHGEIDFWSVRMRPAKPLAFGILKGDKGGDVPHIGLPGNPVSALVAFEQFARPAIYKMMGKTKLSKPTIKAILEDPIENVDGRRVYARAIVTKKKGKYYAKLTGDQSSGVLTSMARANGLAICPESIKTIKVGSFVDVQMLDWIEEE
mgnify:CR=1 FL=1